MRRRLVPVSLVALLLLAGCLGAFDPGSTSEPRRVQPSEADLPPGVDESGVTNASTLVAAHDEALRAEGFVLNGTFVRDPPSAGNNTRRFHTVVAPGGDRFRAELVSSYAWTDGANATQERRFRTQLWHDSSGTYQHVRTVQNGTATKSIRHVPTLMSLTRAPQYETYLEIGDYTVDSVVARDGHTFTTLVADDARESSDGIDDFSARFVVDERGVVHEVVVDIDGTGATETSDHAEYRIVHLGGSPEEPDWVANVSKN